MNRKHQLEGKGTCFGKPSSQKKKNYNEKETWLSEMEEDHQTTKVQEDTHITLKDITTRVNFLQLQQTMSRRFDLRK